ncbi:hypothetical protein MBLNU230_g8553t1 [Neophaeotheca triangularis]
MNSGPSDDPYPPLQSLQYGNYPYQPPVQAPYAYSQPPQQQQQSQQQSQQQPSSLNFASHQTPQSQPPPLPETLSYPQQQSQSPAPTQSSRQPPERGRGRPRKQQQQEQRPQVQSPGNGPGAPPPQSNSPSADYELNLVNALGGGTGQQEQGINERSQEEDGNDNGEGEDDPVFHIPPPPEGIFPGADALEEHIHAWSLEHGYEMVRRANRKNAKGQFYKRYYNCRKHGKMSNTGGLTDQTRQRLNRKSNRTGCPMSLTAVACDPQNAEGEWQIRLRITHHNHGPLDALSMPGHRRRARMGGVEKAVDGLFAIGNSTAQVLTFLQRTNPNGLFTRADVGNMKLTYNMYGTCVHRKEEMKQGTGYPSACTNCRAKKTRCNSVRPTCGTCERTNATCHYDHDLSEAHPAVQQRSGIVRQDGDEDVEVTTSNPTDPNTTTTAPSALLGMAAGTTTHSTPNAAPRRSGISKRQQNIEDASAILANLAAINPSHAQANQNPKEKLTLQSSFVESLAQASTGTGESYQHNPPLQTAADWPQFSRAFLAASRRENTADVLLGQKVEPRAPKPAAGEEEVERSVWNEYIRQLAIYNRRNNVLLSGFWTLLAPIWRSRVEHLKHAKGVWEALEHACRPTGAGGAFAAYEELMATTLEGCGGDVAVFIRELERGWRELNAFAPNHSEAASAGTGGQDPFTTVSANEGRVLSEEMLTFLFLRNLNSGSDDEGEDDGGRRAFWRKWAQGLVATSNVGGFGTGPRIGWRGVVMRAEEAGGMGLTL